MYTTGTYSNGTHHITVVIAIVRHSYTKNWGRKRQDKKTHVNMLHFPLHIHVLIVQFNCFIVGVVDEGAGYRLC